MDPPSRPVFLDTDPALALKTRKGTGFYKIPSLRGLWYRPRLMHDGALTSLEEMFDPARQSPDYEPRGWNPVDVAKRSIDGHLFGLAMPSDDKRALIACTWLLAEMSGKNQCGSSSK